MVAALLLVLLLCLVQMTSQPNPLIIIGHFLTFMSSILFSSSLISIFLSIFIWPKFNDIPESPLLAIRLSATLLHCWQHDDNSQNRDGRRGGTDYGGAGIQVVRSLPI